MKGRPASVAVPVGDHPIVTEHVVRRVVQIVTAALTDLDTVLSVHGDAAPTSVSHVYRFVSAVAAETIDCLESWPS